MELIEKLSTFLKIQLTLFSRVVEANDKMKEVLNNPQEFQAFMDLLDTKNKTIEEIQEKSQMGSPLIAEYMQLKLEKNGEVEGREDVDNLLREIEGKVEAIKVQDEYMMGVFKEKLGTDKPQNPNDIINAFRAMR